MNSRKLSILFKILIYIVFIPFFSCENSEKSQIKPINPQITKDYAENKIRWNIKDNGSGTIIIGTSDKMSTVFTISVGLENQNKEKIKQIINKVKHCFNIIQVVEDKMSSFSKKGDLYNLNKSDKNWVKVSKNSYDVIAESLNLSKITNGAFDISWVALRKLYKFHKKGWIPPTNEIISEQLKKVGWKKIKMDTQNHRIKFDVSHMKVDLGAIAKGFSIDLAGKYLKENKINNFIINGGGDLLISGKKPSGKWIVAIRHPRGGNLDSIKLGSIKDGALVTSGDYERYVKIKGVRFSHILDPVTGKPSKGVISVSILGPVVMKADGLATSIFVLGVSKGLKVIEKLKDYEALIIDHNLKIHKSSGFDTKWEK
jgi:FAD:protein FMN transferase